MNQYFMITKILFKNAFRSDKLQFIKNVEQSKAKSIRNVVLAVCLFGFAFVPVLIGFCYMIYAYSEAMAINGAHADLYATLLSISQIVVLVFGMVSLISMLYRSTDLEFLGQLPVKPAVIFWAKMTYVYVTEAVIAIVMIIPATIGFVLGVHNAGVAIPWGFYVLTPVSVLVGPIVPLLFANLLAVPIVYITKKLKNRTYIGLIVAVVLYIGLMLVYMLVVNKFNAASGDEEGNFIITDEMINGIMVVSKVFFYNRWLSLAMCGSSALNLLFYVLFLAAMVTACYVVCVTFYNRNAKNCLEDGVSSGKKTKTQIELKSDDVKITLLKREWKMLIGEFSFAFNTLLSVIMPLILLGMTTIMGATEMSGFGQEEGEELTKAATKLVSAGFVFIYGIFCICGMDYSASLSVSREGRTFYINKYLPVEPEVIIAAKVRLADLIGLAGAVATGIAGAIFMDIGFHALGVMVLVELFNLGFNRLCILRDLKKPSLGWTNPTEATKKNLYPMVPMFYAIAVGVVAEVGAVLLVGLKNDVLATVLFYVIMIAIGVTFMLINAKRLKNKGVQYFENIEQSV